MRADPRRVACPTCTQPPGSPCQRAAKFPGGRGEALEVPMVRVHAARVRVAREARDAAARMAALAPQALSAVPVPAVKEEEEHA